MRAHRRAFFRVIVTLGVVALLSALLSDATAAGGESLGPVAAGTKCPPSPGRVSCYALIQPVPIKPNAVLSTGPYSPTDLRNAYRVPSSTTTETVAVVDAFGAPTLESDLATYRKHFGRPQCTQANGCLRIMGQDGGPALPEPPSGREGWVDETILDVEMVSAICPTCHILLVQADSDYLNDMITAVEYAASTGAKYISMSWGTPESTNGQHLTSLPGVVYVAASGDSGYGTSYPSADPEVVSVGGTSLKKDTSPRGWTDTVWNNGMGGSGGGCSAHEAQPDWQRVIPGLSGVCGNRSMNDVSILGDPDTGVYVYDQGSWVEGGGTSAGAPMIAAMYAIAGQPSDTLPGSAIPYQHPGAFADVITGSNGSCGPSLCSAMKGYDVPSGLGVPQGVGAFVADGSPHVIELKKPVEVTSYRGQSLSVKLRAKSANSAEVTFFAAGLPKGLTLRSDGTVFGKPLTLGRTTVRLTVVDTSGATATTSFAWTVSKLHKFVAARAPKIIGKVKVGGVVSASVGTLRRDSMKGAVVRPAVKVQWLVNGKAVKGATKASFRIPAKYKGMKISFRATVAKTAFKTVVHVTPHATVH